MQKTTSSVAISHQALQPFTVLLLAYLLVLSFGARADKAPDLPGDWASWKVASTPLAKIGALPDCDANVSSLPPIYQETVATYCSVKPGGPGKVAILVNPAAFDAYQKRHGQFPDGVNMLLHLQDMKVLFATYYSQGKPGYAVFSETGERIQVEGNHPLASDTCLQCHTGYGAYCVYGQCGIHQ
jgi:hypothetical protein